MKFGQSFEEKIMKIFNFCQNCEIWSKLQDLVKIVKFGQHCEIWSDLSNSVWFSMALYGLGEILKLYVGSGRFSVGSGRLSVGSGRFSLGSRRLSGWMGLKSGGWVGQMGG